MKNILVLCTGNSCRSQIAHGFLEFYTNKNEVKVYSAGIETHGVNPKAIEVMNEDGIDISSHTSNHVDEYQNDTFNYVITVCENGPPAGRAGKDRCPYFPALEKQFHQNFADPAQSTGATEEVLNEFRKVRDAIKAYCKTFVDAYLIER